MTGDAYELLIETLSQPLVVGHAVVGMRDSRDGTYIDTWEFLCKHPCKSPIPLYCKIGLHGSKLYINLISLHVDDGSQKLQNAIEAFLKAQK